jgi:hypothetical protein
LPLAAHTIPLLLLLLLLPLPSPPPPLLLLLLLLPHQAIVEDDCTKVVLQFVVKLHAKKGTDLLSKFVHVITTAAYSHRSICDIQELGCHAHHVSSIEVRELLGSCFNVRGFEKSCASGVQLQALAVLHRQDAAHLLDV